MHVERMGDQCVNIAKLIVLAGDEAPLDANCSSCSERWARSRRTLVAQCEAAFRDRDLPLATDLLRQEADMSKLNRADLPRRARTRERPRTREWATYMVLVARALDRIADNAVDIGEQVAFVVTGLFQEFSDSFRPAIRTGMQA